VPLQHLLGWAVASLLAAALSVIIALVIRPAVARHSVAPPPPRG
jgi:membrane protein implicated in regulation of membrane protease activity